MSEVKQVNRLLNELAIDLNLNELTLNHDNYCNLNFDDNISIDICWSEDLQLLITMLPIGRIDKENDDLPEELLAANHLWQQTSGATLSLSEDGDFLWMKDKAFLSQFRSAGDFSRYINALLSTARDWRNKIQGVETIHEPPAPDRQSPTFAQIKA